MADLFEQEYRQEASKEPKRLGDKGDTEATEGTTTGPSTNVQGGTGRDGGDSDDPDS